MWGWFKRKAPPPNGEAERFVRKLLTPMATVAVLAENVRTYFEAVKAGSVSFPAHRRKGASVVQIWIDLRLEALRNLFDFGYSDPTLLADHRRQLELLNCYLDERPHLEMPQPRGEAIPDTIQAVWQVYVYLSDVGTEVLDRDSWSSALENSGRSLLDKLNESANELRSQWVKYDGAVRSNSAPLPELPRTLIEALWEDVTAKSKSVALTTIFGPSYETGINFMEQLVVKQGGDASTVRESMNRILAAKDPDEIIANQQIRGKDRH